MSNFKISIVIPTLNEERFLPKILTDLTKQTAKDFDVTIVDGASSDKTIEVTKPFKRFLPLQVYQVRKRNVSFQRNFGAKKTHGEYLLFLDADSRITRSFIRNLLVAIERTQGKLFLPYIISEKKKATHKIMFKLANFIVKTSHTIGKPFSSGGSFLIEKQLFHFMGGFDEKLYLGEDHDLVQRVHHWGVKANILKDTKLIVSVRRSEKESDIKYLYKYLLATSYIIINGKITYKIFEYEMGGQGYERQNHEVKGLISIPIFFLTLASTIIGSIVILSQTTTPLEREMGERILSYRQYSKVLISKVIEPIKKTTRTKEVKRNFTTGFITA